MRSVQGLWTNSRQGEIERGKARRKVSYRCPAASNGRLFEEREKITHILVNGTERQTQNKRKERREI